MRAVVAGVVPVVIGAPFPGDARGVAALDCLVLKVGVDVVEVAVVKAGILDADHLSFAGVAFQLHVVDVAGVVRPGLVVEKLLYGVGLNEGHVSPFGQTAGLKIGHVRPEAGFQGVVDPLGVLHSQFLGRLHDGGDVFFPDRAHLDEVGVLAAINGSDAGGAARHIEQLVLGQELSGVKEREFSFDGR